MKMNKKNIRSKIIVGSPGVAPGESQWQRFYRPHRYSYGLTAYSTCAGNRTQNLWSLRGNCHTIRRHKHMRGLAENRTQIHRLTAYCSAIGLRTQNASCKELNLRRTGLQPDALPTELTRRKSSVRDSNPEHTVYKAVALPIAPTKRKCA